MADLQLLDSPFPDARLGSSFPRKPNMLKAGKTHWPRKMYLSQLNSVCGVLVVYLFVFQTGCGKLSAIPKLMSHDTLSLWWLLRGAIKEFKQGKTKYSHKLLLHCLFGLISNTGQERDSVFKSMQSNQDASTLRSWRHGLLSRVLGESGCCP